MNKFLNSIQIFVMAVLLNSCAYAPDMDWVPQIDIEKKFSGVKKEYHENKKLESVTHYKMDLKHGKYTTYYDNGNKNKEVNYIYDKIQGPFKWYYKTGELYQEGTYIDNYINGIVKIYNKEGKIQQTNYYFRGRKIDSGY